MKRLTLLYLRRHGEILLALKKCGFGEGLWNGVGGKVERGETVRAAAIRECREEIGVTAIEPKLVGRLKFYEKSDPDFCHDTSVYIVTQWQNEPHETKEMRPQWFSVHAIPYEQMWPDDRFWLPLLLKDRLFEGTFTIDGKAVVEHHLEEVAA